jgi:hypothetical protein
VNLIQTVLFEELVQGHARHVHAPGGFDKVEQIPPGGLGLLKQKLSDGASEARQKLAMRPSAQALMACLHNLFGGQLLLARSRSPTDAEQAGDGCHGQAGLAMQQHVAEQSHRVVVSATRFEKTPGCLQHPMLTDSQRFFGHAGIRKPVSQIRLFREHGLPSLVWSNSRGIVRQSWRFTQERPKTIWC